MKFLIKLLSTIFYTGFFPYAPGTVGSLIGFAVFYIVRYNVSNKLMLLIYSLLLIILAIFVSDYYEDIKGEKDPSEVVIDEFAAAFLLNAVILPKTFLDYLILFILFRIFDVWKPFPIKSLEKLKGGIAIVLDDIIAAFYSYIIFAVIKLL